MINGSWPKNLWWRISQEVPIEGDLGFQELSYTDFDNRLMLVAAGLWNFYLEAV
jgi:hypothetical protein